MQKLGERSRKSLEGLHPDMIRLMEESVKHSPFDFTITDGVRETQEQQALYAQGRTKPGKRVTDLDGVKKKSKHQRKADGYGRAVDLFPFVNGKVDVKDEQQLLPIIAGHILGTANRLGIKIIWGGLWKGLVDRPHFELVK